MGGKIMAEKIRIGYGKQLFIGSNVAKIDGKEIFQCDNPKMWKDQNGQFIAQLRNKAFAEVATILGARIWFFLEKNQANAWLFYWKIFIKFIMKKM